MNYLPSPAIRRTFGRRTAVEPPPAGAGGSPQHRDLPELFTRGPSFFTVARKRFPPPAGAGGCQGAGWLKREGIAFAAFCAVLLVSLAPAVLGRYAQAAPEIFNEYSVKAAFLYNFAKFIEWPGGSFEDARSPLSICIIGQDPFKENLDFLRNNTVKGRRLLVKRLSADEDLKQCKIVFIGKSEQERVPLLLSSVKNANALTIGEVGNFCKSGGVINLFTEKNLVRFEINVDAAERAGLVISSDLLKLARIVREDGP
jgi:hypothetical protein